MGKQKMAGETLTNHERTQPDDLGSASVDASELAALLPHPSTESVPVESITHPSTDPDLEFDDGGVPAWVEAVVQAEAAAYTSEEELWAKFEDLFPERKILPLERSRVLLFDEALSVTEEAQRFAELGVVRHAPRLEDIATDETRTNLIRSINTTEATEGRDPGKGEQITTRTEQAAATDLEEFLKTFIRASEQNMASPRGSRLRDRAIDLRENLTFIGERERSNAAAVIGEYWRQYLREDAARQICVVAPLHEGDKVKSGAFMAESILNTFSEAELEELSGRIVTDIDRVTSDPGATKIVITEDWIISGSQMVETIKKLVNTDAYVPYAGAIEINLATSSAGRIENGFAGVPIKSVYLSHDATTPVQGSETHSTGYETGSHSSVDVDFEQTYIEPMLREMQSIKSQNLEGNEHLPSVMPGLTAIVRPYRESSLARLKSIQ